MAGYGTAAAVVGFTGDGWGFVPLAGPVMQAVNAWTRGSSFGDRFLALFYTVVCGAQLTG